MTTVESERSVRTRRADPAVTAKAIHDAWSLGSGRVCNLEDDSDLYDLLDWRVDVLNELLRITKAERGSVARAMHRALGLWREVSARTKRPESTLRSQAKE